MLKTPGFGGKPPSHHTTEGAEQEAARTGTGSVTTTVSLAEHPPARCHRGRQLNHPKEWGTEEGREGIRGGRTGTHRPRAGSAAAIPSSSFTARLGRARASATPAVQRPAGRRGHGGWWQWLRGGGRPGWAPPPPHPRARPPTEGPVPGLQRGTGPLAQAQATQQGGKRHQGGPGFRQTRLGQALGTVWDPPQPARGSGSRTGAGQTEGPGGLHGHPVEAPACSAEHDDADADSLRRRGSAHPLHSSTPT